MKSRLLATLAAFLTLSTAQAAVQVTVEIQSSRDKNEGEAGAPAAPAGGASKKVSQSKFMRITLKNVGANPEQGSTVRYWFVGRDMKTMKTSVIGGGEAPVNLGPNSVQVVTSDRLKDTFVPPSPFVAAAKKMPGAAPAPAPATGANMKISGYSAQVVKDGKVIAESFTEPSFKKLIGSEGNKPGDAFVPKTEGEQP